MTSPTFKCLIYIFVAALTALSTELSSLTNGEITKDKWIHVVVYVILQSAIAWKAFLDQSISKKDT